MCCCLTMMKILVIAVILQMVASDDFDWRKTRPAGLLAEAGDPSYRAMTIEDFEIVKEPLIIRFDRDWSSSDVARRQRCVVNNDMGSEMKPEHQVCFCYYSYGVDEKDDYLGCGKDYAYLCSSILDSDFDVYITSAKDASQILVHRTGELYTIPKFTVEEKVGDDGNIVPMIRLKKVQSGCGLIYLKNVYKQPTTAGHHRNHLETIEKPKEQKQKSKSRTGREASPPPNSSFRPNVADDVLDKSVRTGREAAPTPTEKPKGLSTLVWTLIGVGGGAAAGTFIVVVVACVCCNSTHAVTAAAPGFRGGGLNLTAGPVNAAAAATPPATPATTPAATTPAAPVPAPAPPKNAGPEIGSLQMLALPPIENRGVEYKWQPFRDAIKNVGGFRPVHVGDSAPCILKDSKGIERLGNVHIKNEKASFGAGGKEIHMVGPAVQDLLDLRRNP